MEIGKSKIVTSRCERIEKKSGISEHLRERKGYQCGQSKRLMAFCGGDSLETEHGCSLNPFGCVAVVVDC